MAIAPITPATELKPEEEVIQALERLRADVAGALARVHAKMAGLGGAEPLLAGPLPQLLAADSDLQQRLAALDAGLTYLRSPGGRDPNTLKGLLAPLNVSSPLPMTDGNTGLPH